MNVALQENTIQAEIKKVNEVLKQNLQIPYYQRPYRWQEKNVLQLLEDIYSSWKQLKSAYKGRNRNIKSLF